MVQTCDLEGNIRVWRWPVDPFTREPQVDPADVQAIQRLLDESDEIAIHNAKYDVRASATIGIKVPRSKVRCTFFGSHILATNHPHNLTDTVTEHLGIDIERWEIEVKKATQDCRKWIKNQGWNWHLAEEGDPTMPSVKSSTERSEDKPWKNDMWVMREVADVLVGYRLDDELLDHEKELLTERGYPLGWFHATRDYGVKDAEVTVFLWQFMKEEIERRGLTAIFMERLKLVHVAAKLEDQRTTISKKRTHEQIAKYQEHVDLCQAECMAIASQLDFDLELPNAAAPNDSIREFFWGSTRLSCPRCGSKTKHKEWSAGPIKDGAECQKCLKRKAKPGPARVKLNVSKNPCLGLPRVFKGASPSLDKETLDHYIKTLEPGLALDFINSLVGMRSRQTAITYMQSYSRYWLPIPGEDDWQRIATSVNPCGTDHLRWASYNPNSQNVSKKEGFNLRWCFGPAPGREWFSMDGKNLELRIPAYEADETDLIWIFEHPDDAPYYGSYHLAVFDALYPELFAQHGKKVKDLYESTYYQWVKNGNFAVIYGCQRRKADQTYHMVGAYDLVNKRFPKIAALADKQIHLARTRGYVETIPDRDICAERGYPILASRTEDGSVLPTTPLNYHISGTAMQWTNRAMVRCNDQIEQWNAEGWDGWDGFITLQIHDELVFDCPKGQGPEPWLTNLPKMRVLQGLMEAGGIGIGVPTPVSMEYHADSWATGMVL